MQPAPIPGLGGWFNKVLWTRPLSADYVFRNLAVTGPPGDMTLDLVMWSLVHKPRISPIFPVLFVLTRRWPSATFATLLAGLACTAALAGAEASNLATSLVDTGRFVVLFVVAILIASTGRDPCRSGPAAVQSRRCCAASRPSVTRRAASRRWSSAMR